MVPKGNKDGILATALQAPMTVEGSPNLCMQWHTAVDSSVCSDPAAQLFFITGNINIKILN